MFGFGLRIAEIREMFNSGKAWVPPPVKERRDARHGDGYLYVATADKLVLFGIAAGEDLVEARLREHAKTFSDLEYVERFFFHEGEAGKHERQIKKVLKTLDHFPYVPRGTPKWTEVVSYNEWEDLRRLIPTKS